MYIVTKNKGLLWKPENQALAKSGWDEINMQLRYKSLFSRANILCNPDPNWFGNDIANRTQPSILTAWNVLVELMQIEILEKGYYAFVAPTNERGIKFEIVGHKDIVNIICNDDGDISWRIYRETAAPAVKVKFSETNGCPADEAYLDESEGERFLKISDTCHRVANGYIQAQERQDHPEAGRKLRGHLLIQLLAYRPD